MKHSVLSLVLLLSLTACDSDDDAEQTAALNNRPPTIRTTAVDIPAGQTTVIAVQANDQDGDPLTYSLIDNPTWATINAQDGTLTLSPSAQDTGTYQLQVQVCDGLQSIKTTFDVNITLPASSLTSSVCRDGRYTPALCQALVSGDHTAVSEAELLEFTENTLQALADKQTSVIDHLFTGIGSEYSYPTAKSDMYVMDIQSPEDTFAVLHANKQVGSDNIHKITGVLGERNGQRVGLFAQNGFDISASDQVNTYHKNLVSWLTDGKTEGLSIVLSQQMWKDLMPHQKTKEWFAHYFPSSTVNDIKTCDFENLAVCIDEKKPDLIIYGDARYDNKGFANVKAGLEQAKAEKIPLLVTGYYKLMSGQGAAMIKPMYDWLELGYGENGNTRPYGDHIDVNALKSNARLNAAINLIQRLRDKSFTMEATLGCSTYFIGCDASQFNTEFGDGAKWLRGLILRQEKMKVDVFKDDTSSDLIKAIHLLADKYRSQIDYPITRTETSDFFKAMFADFFVAYARSDNRAQPDLGQHMVHADQVIKGENASYELPKTVTETKTIEVNATSSWGTSTGWYALPGQPVTLTRNDNSNLKVNVQLHYSRYNTNRVYEDSKSYRGPIEQYINRFELKPNERFTFSTPYGGPIYLVISGGSPLAVNVTAENVGLHPTITDFSSEAQINTFVERYLNSPLPHVDLKSDGAEQHLRKDRFMAGEVTAEGVKEMLRSIQQDHIGTIYTLAGYKIPGKALAQSLSPDVVTLCRDRLMASDCLDETLHSRTSVQHANYDQNAQCGVGCAGNPWDSGANINPVGWLDNHELGHNLQTSRISGDYVTESNRNDWSHYASRRGENSNNIFPYYVMWKYHYHTQGNTSSLSDSHMNNKDVFYGYMSDLLNVKDDSGNRFIYDAKCGKVANGDRYTAPWESNGYAFANGFRMAFYIQLALQIDKMAMGNGKILNSGFDIYTLLYLHGRIFDKHNRNETDWLQNRDQLGFSEFAFAGDVTYGSGNTVAKIPGNDFMLVSLSHLSKRDWRPFFDVFGLRYSDLAAKQVAINASNGPVRKGLYQLNTELPDASISDGLEFLDLSTATKDTLWFDGGSPAQCGQ